MMATGDAIDSIREVLEEAAQTRRPIRIVYNGGSQPGAVREITPLMVSHIDMPQRWVPSFI
jgi:hypothetical protein